MKKLTAKEIRANSLISQHNKILKWFKNISPRLTTIEAREKLGILQISARICELRRHHEIALQWVERKDVAGVSHRCGQYVYLGEKSLEKAS